ncbi:MAG: acetylpolyamine aminohydrolase [Caulobacterales bacterium RIFCSPHIGHO2_01_FULL_70_19]|nr:MAG: acetylpolyamine aminohydrolase [Caulobacterales bacterium RIFCSPHIGHO2_01_FULL_70_19]
MLTFYSDDHHLHHGSCELIDGQLMPCFEKPQRADHILQRVKDRQLGEVRPPQDFGLAPIERIHSAAYLNFFKGAWARWQAQNGSGDLLPFTWPARTLRQVIPRDLHGQLGYYSFDGGAPITAGTWQAAYSAAQVALSGQQAIANGAHSAFALCRPPGHHAAGELMGGYCYLNNAAIAARAARDAGHARVAVLDVDYHHGNGTQDIFLDDGSVFFASIHADPASDYPFFWGHADERGVGEGEGATLNLPLPRGTTVERYTAALDTALEAIARFDPSLLVISFGADTFEGDPISHFRIATGDYPRLAERIAALGRPTLIVMEGGYAVAELADNVEGFLSGF